jgi:hypothetical protein
VGNTFEISKEYSAKKFNSKFSTWWFQIMPAYYDDQILRAKASMKLKIPFSTPTEMSHEYLYRKTAKELFMIIIYKERCEGDGFLKITLNSIPSLLMCSQIRKNYKMFENHSKN